MDVGGDALSALLWKGDVRSFYEARLDSRMFIGDELIVFTFVEQFLQKFHALPKPATVARHLGVDLPKMKEAPAYYLDRLTQRYRHRTLHAMLIECNALMKDQDSESALARVYRTVQEIHAIETRARVSDFRDDGSAIVWNDYITKLSGDSTGIFLGWPSFDRMSAGLGPGDILSLIGRPGLGKSWFTLFFCLNAWRAQNCDVIFVSMEMPTLQIMQRLVALDSSVTVGAIQKAGLTTYQMELMKSAEAEKKNHTSRFWVVDGNLTTTVDELEMLSTYYRPKLVVVDGAYLMGHSDKRLNKYQRVEANIEKTKQMAQRLGVPVILSFQFNRDAVRKQKKGKERPDLEDIAHTDAIGQLSSIVLGMFQEEGIETILAREIAILKGRSGEVGTFRVNWRFDTMDFSEIEKENTAKLHFV